MAAFRNDGSHSENVAYDLFEFIFLTDMILTFFVDYQPIGQQSPVRSFKNIGINYIKGKFAFELIPLLPLQKMKLPH